MMRAFFSSKFSWFELIGIVAIGAASAEYDTYLWVLAAIPLGILQAIIAKELGVK